MERNHAVIAIEDGVWKLQSAILPRADGLDQFLVGNDRLRYLPPEEKAVISFAANAQLFDTQLRAELRKGLSPGIMSDLVARGTIVLE